jgi:hypothetical protein
MLVEYTAMPYIQAMYSVIETEVFVRATTEI